MAPLALLALLALFAFPALQAAPPAVGGPPALPSLPQGTAAKPEPAPTPTPSPEVASDSPRSSVAEFLELCNEGNTKGAARFLDLPPGSEEEGPVLARKLKAVLDRHLWIDMEKVSPLTTGNREDNLPPDVDELGTIPAAHGRREPVRVIRWERADTTLWVFSRITVSRIPAWYDALPDRFLRDRLPDALFRAPAGPFFLWQWIALLVGIPILVVAGHFLGWGTKRLAIKVTERTGTPWVELLVQRLTGPVSVFWSLLLARAALPLLSANDAGYAFVVAALKALFVLDLLWALTRSIRVGAEAAAASAWAKSNPSAPSILSLGVRVGEVTILFLGALGALAEIGIPLASLLAGLGIGGIALALAAQKTVENLFGSVSLAVDQPLRVGDYVRIGEFTGTVEAIGLRSTRLRTLDRTVVTIPNGKLADREIETFAVRDRIRLACVLGLDFGTTAAKMRTALSGIEGYLRSHPKVWKEQIVVRFLEIGASSLNIEVMTWVETTDFQEFRAVREELLLGFLSAVEAAGTGFAFPMRTVQVVSGNLPLPPAQEIK